ncbi:uncharacterized protein LOC143227966 [Tachypleus tridentatus]|uniref:uncharacterized protein LOC143227966 n=1 Tax=Tachypleus tridentatus TaxID=6853 RepID=UPI003FD1CD8F
MKASENLPDVPTLLSFLESDAKIISPFNVVVACSWVLMRLMLEKIRKNSLLLGPNFHWFLLLEENDYLPLVCNYTDRDNNILVVVQSTEQHFNVYKVEYNPLFGNSTMHQLDTWYAQRKSDKGENYLGSFSAKTDLQGRTLKVALERHFPFFLPAKEEGKQNPIGVDIKVLNALQEVLKFR